MLALSAVVLSACNNGDKAKSDAGASKVAQEDENVIHKLPRLHVQDTCRVGANTYSWEIDRTVCESMDVVVDDMGFRYADNMVKLVVHLNGNKLYGRTFTKLDFAHLVGDDFLTKSILDGCRFLQIQDGKITFSLAVSYPDSDMSQPFKLDIASDGSSNLVKSNDIEDEYLPDSLMRATSN